MSSSVRQVPLRLGLCVVVALLLAVPAISLASVHGGGAPSAPRTVAGSLVERHHDPAAPSSRSPRPLTPTYPVTFSAVGLPCCWNWAVTIAGLTLGTNGGSVTFYEPNGTYTYGVADLVYYVPSPSSGTVAVSGSGTSVAIDFYSPPTYVVQVNQTGLPASATWTIAVHFHDVPGSELYYNVTGANAQLNLRNDTYDLRITGPSNYGVLDGATTISVASRPVYYDVSFHVGAYDLTFAELGLPAGTAWSVVVNGGANTSTNATIVDFLNDGSYSYLIGDVPGYIETPHLGTVFISGGNDLVSVTFRPAVYVVNVTATGLPTGLSWSVTVNGTTWSSATSTLTFSEPNGTYAYTVGGVGGYTASAYSGQFTIDGLATSLTVAWSVTLFAVVFEATGLAAGTTWDVVVGQTTQTSHNATVTLDLANGSYSYMIAATGGFAATPSTGSVNVTGAALVEPVSFHATSTGSWWSASVVPGVPTGLLLVVVVVVAVLAVAMLLLRSRRRRRPTT